MASDKICLICNQRNPGDATVCSLCGSLLDGNPTDLVAITEYIGGPSNVLVEDSTALIDTALIPEGGVAIHAAGAPRPYYVPVHRELILGRPADATLEAVLDLSDMDAFNMGISRRHAMLRRADFGFDIIDLNSRNGTWLNAKQLIPNRPYPVASGSQLRLGRLQLFIVYHVTGKDPQKK